MKVPPELISFLKEKDNFFIATHINPDGGAIGSSLALLSALESIGKNALIYDKDPVPEIYRFLPGYENFTHSISGLNPSAHNLILLDCNSLDRVGIDGVSFPFTSVIDHHETEKELGDIKWVKPDAAATGIMVFSLLKTILRLHDLGIIEGLPRVMGVQSRHANPVFLYYHEPKASGFSAP